MIRPATDLAALAAALAALRRGDVIAYPTDTVYALGALCTSVAGVAGVMRVKGRLPEKTLPLIAADVAQVAWLTGALSNLAARLAAQFWPGPLTLIVPVAVDLAPGVVALDGSVAVRVPACDVARALARDAGVPLIATSANRSGSPAAMTADEAAALGAGVFLVLDGGAALSAVTSTIVDVRGAEPRLIRAGAVPFEEVLEYSRRSPHRRSTKDCGQ